MKEIWSSRRRSEDLMLVFDQRDRVVRTRHTVSKIIDFSSVCVRAHTDRVNKLWLVLKIQIRENPILSSVPLWALNLPLRKSKTSLRVVIFFLTVITAVRKYFYSILFYYIFNFDFSSTSVQNIVLILYILFYIILY